jgi:hypothetical protein
LFLAWPSRAPSTLSAPLPLVSLLLTPGFSEVSFENPVASMFDGNTYQCANRVDTLSFDGSDVTLNDHSDLSSSMELEEVIWRIV